MTVPIARTKRTRATVRKRPKRVKAGSAAVELPRPATYCGLCTGHTVVWCPGCWGFEGCATCKHTYKVPCPECSGGKVWPLPW